ncbi:MAG: VTT domain-containing protein [Minisyncoccia bacterium]
MFFSPSDILSLLEHYKYFIIFPIAVLEGPIIIIISGFLVYLKVLNFYVAVVLLILADTIGDSLYYSIGRYWRISEKMRYLANYFGYSEKSQEYLENHFEKHKAKTFLLAKISHGLGGTVQIASGIARVKYKEFLFYSVLGTTPKTIILITIGYYLGSYYKKIDGYLNMFAYSVIGAILLFLIYKLTNKYIKNYFKNSSGE